MYILQTFKFDSLYIINKSDPNPTDIKFQNSFAVFPKSYQLTYLWVPPIRWG